jgi:hypothetical protein
MASDENPILEAVSRVLEPLGAERKAEVVTWVAEHMAQTPLTTYLYAKAEAGDATPYHFEINSPNPLNPDTTVFAIFHWHVQGCFVVYSLAAVTTEDGGAQGMFTRDVVFEPRFASGPVSLDALYHDLNYHLHATPWDDIDPEDDVPPSSPAADNGSRRAAGPRS